MENEGRVPSSVCGCGWDGDDVLAFSCVVNMDIKLSTARITSASRTSGIMVFVNSGLFTIVSRIPTTGRGKARRKGTRNRCSISRKCVSSVDDGSTTCTSFAALGVVGRALTQQATNNTQTLLDSLHQVIGVFLRHADIIFQLLGVDFVRRFAEVRRQPLSNALCVCLQVLKESGSGAGREIKGVDVGVLENAAALDQKIGCFEEEVWVLVGEVAVVGHARIDV